MLGAVLLGALALTGTSGTLWWSDAPPHAGQPYIGVSYTGTDDFGCGATVAARPVPVTAYRIDNTTICVFRIPKGTAGKKLAISYSTTHRTVEPGGTRITEALGLVQPKLIRR